MNRRNFVVKLLGGGTAALAALGLASCAGYGPGHGPPAHAPAHGYRRKHRGGVDLVYDAGLGVYVVVGHPYYYLDDRFYRAYDGVWQISAGLNGPWQAVAERSVPPGLQKKARGGGHGGSPGGPPRQSRKK